MDHRLGPPATDFVRMMLVMSKKYAGFSGLSCSPVPLHRCNPSVFIMITVHMSFTYIHCFHYTKCGTLLSLKPFRKAQFTLLSMCESLHFLMMVVVHVKPQVTQTLGYPALQVQNREVCWLRKLFPEATRSNVSYC